MSLHIAAQHLASRGRGPDTTLVHMAPSEVAGLQALAKAHGGSLTLNPDTGLPEAGFLSSILPTVLGVGLAATGVGAPMAAMLVGGGYGLATGSLSKGLMAGLGAYGGAGLGAGLMGTGAQALGAETAAGLMGANQAAAMAPQTAAQLGSGFESAMAAQGVAPVAQTAAQAMPVGYEAFSPTAANYGAFGEAPIQAAQAVQQAAPQTVTQIPTQPYSPEAIEAAVQERMQNASISDKLSAGLGAYAKTPEALLTAENAKYGLAALAPSMMAAMTPQQAQYKGSGPNPYRYRYEIDRPQLPYSGSSREAMQLTGRYVPYAAGGPIEAMSEQNAAETLMANGGQMYADGGAVDDVAKGMTGASADAFRYLMGQAPTSPVASAAQSYTPAPMPVAAAPEPTQSQGGGWLSNMLRKVAGSQNPQQKYTFDPATGTYTQLAGGGIASLAMGGESHLGDYSDGGRLLKGPGDGVSDSIPATIADKRPARLADGEFVVPARIVSELGNGSTDAGARKLYAMMDRIQKARNKTTGKDRVAVDSRADKALPA